MRRLRPLLAVALLLGLAPVLRAGDEPPVTVVLDRSASLRHADPEGQGLRALAQALVLALRPGQELAILAQGVDQAPAPLPEDPAALAQRLAHVLSATPAAGGLDLQPLLERAAKRGPGVVVLYGDDDLDVVGPGGEVPPAALALAKESTPRPARDALNQAALQLLRRSLGEQEGLRLVALVAPLPGGARVTPYLAALGAERIPLDGEAPLRLATAIRGGPVGQRLELAPEASELSLPYPARVTLAARRPLQLKSGSALDGEGRLWVLDLSAACPLPPNHGPLTAYVAPRLPAPSAVRAFRLQDGSVRVLAAAAPSYAELVALSGDTREPLRGAPPSALLRSVPAERTALRAALRLSDGLLGAAAEVPIEEAKAVLSSGELRVGTPARFELTLTDGLPVEAFELEVRESSGRFEVIPVEISGAKARASYTPRGAGALRLSARGPLRLEAPALEVAASLSYTLELDAPQAAGQVVELASPLALDGEGRASLKLTLRVDPAPAAPVQVSLGVEGIEGARLEPADPIALSGEASVERTLVVPQGRPPNKSLALKLTAAEGETQRLVPASRPLPLQPPPSWKRLFVAAGLVLLALVWGLLLWIARRREKQFVTTELKDKQLRTIGRNGRLSPERYMFRHHLISEEEGVIVDPDESPEGSLLLQVRRDGKVEVTAQEGAKLIHEDRPTVLANKLILEHGTAFAMVSGQRALRYVYLSEEPSGEELSKRYLDGASLSAEEMRDSGVFVLLDDKDNIPTSEARLDASQELVFPSSQETFGASSSVRVVPPSDSGRQPLVSDEGIVIMNSDEGEILDSQDLDFLEQTQVDELPLASDSTAVSSDDDSIKLEDLLGGD